MRVRPLPAPTHAPTPQHAPTQRAPARPNIPIRTAGKRSGPTRQQCRKTQMPSAPAKFAPKRSSHAERDADRKRTRQPRPETSNAPQSPPNPPHPHRTPRTLDAGKR
eukprot:6019392-Prymnesium_polylepis.1